MRSALPYSVTNCKRYERGAFDSSSSCHKLLCSIPHPHAFLQVKTAPKSLPPKSYFPQVTPPTFYQSCLLKGSPEIPSPPNFVTFVF